MNKINIMLIIILLILSIIFLEVNRDYMIGKVISTDETGHNAILEAQSSNCGLNKGNFKIHSNKLLNIDDTVKIKFKYSFFKDNVIKMSSPAQFSQDYYIKILSQ